MTSLPKFSHIISFQELRAFKEELPIDNTRGVVFGSTIGVAGKDLLSDGGIDLLIESLMVKK